jgi:multimeric flavodoxin WrbA
VSILVVWASPNTDGLTAAAKDSVMEGIASAGDKAEALHLNACDIQRCRTCGNGWGTCATTGKCVIQDDFGAVYDKLVAADGIVWVTPVYWHDLAECLKSYMDRLRRCETRVNHFLKDRKCLLVACAGGSGNGTVQCLARFEDTLRHMQMAAVDRLPVTRFSREYMLPALSGAGQAFALRLQAARK